MTFPLDKLIEQAEQRLAALKIYQETGDAESVQRHERDDVWTPCKSEQEIDLYWMLRPTPDYVRPDSVTKACEDCGDPVPDPACWCNKPDTWPKAFREKGRIWIASAKDDSNIYRASLFTDGEFTCNGRKFLLDGEPEIPLTRAYELVSWPRYFKNLEGDMYYKAFSPNNVQLFTRGVYIDNTGGYVNNLDATSDVTEITAAEFGEWQRSFDPEIKIAYTPERFVDAGKELMEQERLVGKNPMYVDGPLPEDVQERIDSHQAAGASGAPCTDESDPIWKAQADGTFPRCDDCDRLCLDCECSPQKIGGFEIPKEWVGYEVFLRRSTTFGCEVYYFNLPACRHERLYLHQVNAIPNATILWSDGSVGFYPRWYMPDHEYCEAHIGLKSINDYHQTKPIAVIVKDVE